MYIINLEILSPAGKLHKSTLQVVCQVPLRMRYGFHLLSVLNTVTDDQEANSDLISKPSVYI